MTTKQTDTPLDRPAVKSFHKKLDEALTKFAAFDALIIEHFSNGEAIVKQEDVVKRVRNCRTEWLNVESAYEAAGWKVKYDKPGYNETYPATFTFSVKR